MKTPPPLYVAAIVILGGVIFSDPGIIAFGVGLTVGMLSRMHSREGDGL